MSKKNNTLDPNALNENGVSAKKAEECMAASCETGLTDLGQSGSVPVGQKEVSAPHLDAEQLKNETPKAESCDSKKADHKTDHKADHKAQSKADDKSKTKSEPEEHQSVATIGLEVAAGLAMMAVDSAGKVFKDAGKNWEGKVDAAANKAHETIESAQRAIKDPLGETLKQVEHLTHQDKPEKSEKSK